MYKFLQDLNFNSQIAGRKVRGYRKRNLPKVTGFKERVLEVVSKIPKGQTLTYKQVAARAGSPGAYRAVGNIMASNEDPRRIPCHRVIGSDGRMRGYARGGIKKKAAILKKEGAILKLQN